MKTDSQGYVWCVKVEGDNVGKERWMAPSFVNNKSMMKELGWKVWEPEQPMIAPNGEVAKIKVATPVSTVTIPDVDIITYPEAPETFEPSTNDEKIVVEKKKRKRIETKPKRIETKPKRKYNRKPKTEITDAN